MVFGGAFQRAFRPAFDAGAAPASNWYIGGGVSQGSVVAAYKAISKANLAASLVNEVSPGTYDWFISSPITTWPSWDSATGWNFNQGQFCGLRNGLVPNTVKAYSGNFCPFTWVCRYDNLAYGKDRQFLMGAGGRGLPPSMFLWPIYSASNTTMRVGNHNTNDKSWSLFGGLKASGVFAQAGQTIYLYDPIGGFQTIASAGVNYGGSITTDDFMLAYDVSSVTYDWTGDMRIQCCSIYSEVLNATELGVIMPAAYALT